MKKIYSLLLGAATVLMLALSCSDKDFDDKYYDPSKTTTVSCDRLMTGAFIGDNTGRYAFNSYWRMYTWDNYFGHLAQTIGYSVNSGSMYYVNDGYVAQRWDDFYGILRQYRVMQAKYESETAEEQDRDKLFLTLTEIFLYDQLSQIVDIFGPVPFSQAGYLPISGNLATSYPAYDSDVDLYRMMIEELGSIYTYLSNLGLSAVQSASLTAQDFINKGDLDLWIKYANALRLRLAVHVSAQGDLTSVGRGAVAECASRPLPTDWETSIKLDSDYDGFKFWENFRDGFKDINYTASQPMIDEMQITGENDPRLKVIYTPNADGEYYGMSTSETDEQQNERSTYTDYEDRYYAHLDSATFVANGLMQSPVISAAECYFLLAEAYAQGYGVAASEASAKTAFQNGVVASIEQWYNQNVNSDQTNIALRSNTYKATAEDIPTEDEARTYADKVWDAHGNAMEAIMTQKWLHFGIMQATQAWTDIRRTGLPDLYYPTDGQASVNKNIVQRTAYPGEERNNNKENYDAIISSVGNDSFDHVLFWAKKVD